jgi:hypothetical protein
VKVHVITEGMREALIEHLTTHGTMKENEKFVIVLRTGLQVVEIPDPKGKEPPPPDGQKPEGKGKGGKGTRKKGGKKK